METYNRGRNVVRRELIQPSQQRVAGRLLAPLQDGQMVGVENDRHQRLAFEFTTADEAPEANNFRIGFVTREVP